MKEKYCPRAYHVGKSPRRFLVAKDPAVQQIARKVVAGVDRKYHLYPCYRSWTKGRRDKEQIHETIRGAVLIPGACDCVQTDMGVGGIGLFGGLSDDGTEFIFYEWTSPGPRLRLHMTAQDARDIVAGKKKYVMFLPCTKAHFAARKRFWTRQRGN